MSGAWSQRGDESRRSAAGPRPCERCGALVITQWTRGSASLKVTADAEPISPERAAVLREPDRLAWCLAPLHAGGAELRWRCRHECGHRLVIEHRCPEGLAQYGRRPEGAMW